MTKKTKISFFREITITMFQPTHSEGFFCHRNISIDIHPFTSEMALGLNKICALLRSVLESIPMVNLRILSILQINGDFFYPCYLPQNDCTKKFHTVEASILSCHFFSNIQTQSSISIVRDSNSDSCKVFPHCYLTS